MYLKLRRNVSFIYILISWSCQLLYKTKQPSRTLIKYYILKLGWTTSKQFHGSLIVNFEQSQQSKKDPGSSCLNRYSVGLTNANAKCPFSPKYVQVNGFNRNWYTWTATEFFIGGYKLQRSFDKNA